ncbi:MAG: hypothetical protein AAGK74_01240, partial [Chloroflexota bacterium]
VIAYDDTDFPTRPTSITDATGQPTTFSYTDDGRVETVTATDGIVTTIEYDASGQVKRTVSSDSGGDLDNETRFAYDVQGRLTLSCEIRSTERCQHMEYDPAGNVIRTIQNVTDMDTGTPEIDGDFSNITRADSTTTQNLITEMTYDIAGNLIWVSDVEERVTLMAYDGDNRLIRVVRNCATDTTSEPVAWCTNTTDPFTITHANRLVLGEAGYAMVSDLNITTDYTYDAVDNLTGVTNTLGRVDYTCYDIQNRPVRTVQNAVTLTYEQACAEQAPAPASTDADIITAYLYDNVGNLLITTYPSTNEGTRYDFVCYDALNRPIRTIQNATTTSETLTDDYATACTAVVTPYDHGVPVSSDIINETTYDANGNVVETIDPFGVKTRYLYDDLNRPYAVVANYVDNLTEPTTENITSITRYDAVGNVKAQISPDGQATWMCYDGLRRVTRTVQNVGSSQAVSLLPSPADGYDPNMADEFNQPLVYPPADPQNYPTTGNPCDPAYNPAADSDLDIISEYTYDDLGRVTETTITLDDTTLRRTFTEYDSMNRVSRQFSSYQDGTYDSAATDIDVARQYEYDRLGRTAAVVEAANTGTPRTTVYQYDEMDRTVITIRNAVDRNPDPDVTDYTYSTTNPDANITTTTQYDGVGLVTETSNLIDDSGTAADQLTRTFDYDGLYRQQTVTDPLSYQTEYTYDAVGNLRTMVDATGRSTEYVYDLLYRQTEVTNTVTNAYSGNVPQYDTSSAYDAVGRAIEQTDATGVVTMRGYDDVGRMTWVRENAQSSPYGDNLISNPDQNIYTTYDYDVMGNLTQVGLPDGESLFFEYDRMNRQTTVDGIDTLGVWETVYDKGGRSRYLITPKDSTACAGATPDYATCATATMGYDTLGRIETIDYKQTGYEPTSSVSYTYDVFGMRQTMIDGQGTTQYAYDDLSRLAQVTDTNARIMTYAYDAIGRRTQLGLNSALDGARVITYAYDGHRLDTVTGWDNQTTTYTYDDADRMTGMTLPNNVTASMAYDGDGYLDTLAYTDPASAPLMSYDYDVDAMGNRTRVTETLSGVNGCTVIADGDIAALSNAASNGGTYCLAQGGTYTFTTADSASTDSALPAITTDLTLIGNGATLDTTGATGDFRFFEVNNAALHLQDMTLSSGSSTDGGAIYSDNGTLSLVGVEMHSNTAIGNGGAIYSTGANATLAASELTLTGNTAATGGAIYMEGGAAYIANSDITTNTATTGTGGAGHFVNVRAITERNIVTGNTASNDGGGFNIQQDGTAPAMGATVPAPPTRITLAPTLPDVNQR